MASAIPPDYSKQLLEYFKDRDERTKKYNDYQIIASGVSQHSAKDEVDETNTVLIHKNTRKNDMLITSLAFRSEIDYTSGNDDPHLTDAEMIVKMDNFDILPLLAVPLTDHETHGIENSFRPSHTMPMNLRLKRDSELNLITHFVTDDDTSGITFVASVFVVLEDL